MRLPETTFFDLQGEPGGARLAARLAGDPGAPAFLLLHGFPASSRSFRDVIGPLSEGPDGCFVIAPDLPGFGASDPPEPPSSATFAGFADAIEALLARLGVETFFLYLHDFGAAVGLHLATRAPERVRGLVIQNANAHASGLGPQWADTRAYWADPGPEREAKATAHLTPEGMRLQYVGGLEAYPDLTRRIDPELWKEDGRVLALPGRLETQRALVLDYRSHVARFADIAEYLERWRPPALMLWGRHDIFFELEETLSWMKALPRMEAHVLDGPHFVLETHAAECAARMRAFVRRASEAPAA